MNDLSNNSALCKIKKLLHELGKIQLKSDYHVKLSLYRDGDCEHPSSSHSTNGSSKCRIIKIIAAVGAALIILSIFRNIFRALNSKR